MSYDRLASHYDEGYLHPKDLAENKIVRRLTAPLVPGPVVDLGCGTGLFIDLHDGAVGEYHGLDLSPKMLEVARAKHPDRRFVEHDIDEPWPIEPESVESVVSLFAFHYSERPERVVTEMIGALRPGGRFFLTLCATRWPSRHSYVEGRDGIPRVYTADAAKDLFDRPEFDHVTVRGLSRWVDRVGDKMARLVLETEVATVLRWWPDAAYFLMVQGRKNGF